MASLRVYKVVFAAVAEGDLQAIVEYIAADNSGAAIRVLKQIEARCASLHQMPERGRVVPELVAFGIHNYRELAVMPWRVVYRISGMTVTILAVVDDRRNIEDVLLDRLVRGS
jgi:plasmid stabilization system protein ParE